MRAQRLRVTFARGDLLRYITHLDLMRAWERALKRAGLPVTYSEGFTPHPQIALAMPLPVGATAEGELMDVFLAEPVEPAEFVERLAVQTPPGLSVSAVEEVPVAWPSLQSLVREWRWRARLPEGTDAREVEAAVVTLLARTSIPAEVKREKETKAYDLRPLILDLHVAHDPPHVDLVMRMKAEAGGRPEQVAAALSIEPRTVRVHRLGLVLASMNEAVVRE